MATWSGSHSGCGSSRVAVPTFHSLSGIGGAQLSDHARTCPMAQGGVAIYSGGTSEIVVGLSELITLTRSASSVAISWNVSAAASTNVSGRAGGCPSQTNFSSYPIYLGGSLSTWVFVNATTSYCAAESSWQITGNPYVFDVTTGKTLFAATPPTDSNISGNVYSAYRDVYNYSNASYPNATYNGTSAFSFGTAAATSVSWAPTFYVNGTFVSGDRLLVVATVQVTTVAFVAYEKKAAATTSFLGSGTHGHLDLVGITLR